RDAHDREHQGQREAGGADAGPDTARPLGRTGRDRAHLRLLRPRRRRLRPRPGTAGRRRDGHLMSAPARAAGPFASTGRDALIVDALRPPIGRSHPDRGWFRDVHPNAMLGAVYTALLDGAGLAPEVI